ncbi:uracil-DNA glycosylase [Duganella sp. FT50W]|uniref:Uracil-DNA glycosylase n=2 Tax=Duganella lactea TaxID=2692173 RepID=A0A6L8MGC4_9BURK|nr:uracil-DNA glycosylase [Duganella lactea]
MSQSSARNTVFLQEMGIGVQWTLRDAPGTVDVPVAAKSLAPAEVPSDPVAPALAAPSVVAPPPAVEPPGELPPAIAPRPASPSPAPAGEDTAWFDDAPVPAPVRPATPVPAPAEPASAPLSDEAIAQMDWPALQAAVSSCTRCMLCETRHAAVNGRGAEHATWIAIAGTPSPADEQAPQAVSGEAGQLLDNMLKAIELKPESDVYVTNVVKCRPPERHPSAEEVIACRPFLDRELALTGATMAITFGQFAARGLMMGPASRGKVMRYNQLSVVATYHPDDLLRKPEDKPKAWGDLCLAKASHA